MPRIKAKPDVGYDPDPGKTMRWAGILLPPAAWAIQLQTLWLTTYLGCAYTDFKWNHVASIITLLLSVLGGVIAWQYMPAGPYEPTKEEASPEVRKRFMCILGVALSVMFSVLIIAQWLPTLLAVPCNK